MFHVEHNKTQNVPRRTFCVSEKLNVPRGTFGLKCETTFHVEHHIPLGIFGIVRVRTVSVSVSLVMKFTFTPLSRMVSTA